MEMTKRILTVMLLAASMAFAQSGSSPGSSDQQQPTTNPTDQSNPNNQNTTSTTPSGDQTSVKGCLKQAGSNWVLTADNGQSVTLSGDSSMLKPHDGHEVQVQGTQASDGSLQVSG